MKNILSFLFLFFAPVLLSAQSVNGLQAYFSFDDCLLIDETGLQMDGVSGGAPVNCVCSVMDTALSLGGGASDYFQFDGNYGEILNSDFTISFYFRPENTSGLVDILSVSDSCGGTGMYFSYIPINQSVQFEIQTEGGARRDLIGGIDLRSCWQNVVVARESDRYTIYVNGEVKDAVEVRLSFDMSTIDQMFLANSICLSLPGQLQRLRGDFDELRIYNRALSSNEIADLYFSPDKLFTTDTLIFQGDAVSVRAGKSCANSIQWRPLNGVSDPGVLNPVLSPLVTTEYNMTINYGSCTLRDTVLILVTNEDSLDCNNLLLPTAFSPNGDGLNDLFKISNPFLVDELENWAIFDRNGAVIFETVDPLEGWDGNVNGQSIPPGVFGYRMTYTCKGESYKKIGSFYLMR